MVRQTLNIQIPSGGLNTEITDLADAPLYTSDELNMDILTDGSRARRLGLEYERGYKLSNVSLAESILSESGQVVKLSKAATCYEWTNYKGDGESLVVVQLGNKICFFHGVNNGVLSDEEISYQVNLDDYAVYGYQALKAWTATRDTTTYTYYTESATPSVGDVVYYDISMETIAGNITEEDSGTYTVKAIEREETFDPDHPDEPVYSDIFFTMVRDSAKDSYNRSNDYIRTPVSFASSYGCLFICSPYIEVIKVKIKESYKYTVSTPAVGSFSVSSMLDAKFNSVWANSVGGGRTSITIELPDGTSQHIDMVTYGLSGSFRTTKAFCDTFNGIPASTRKYITVTGDGKKTYTFHAPSGMQYNGTKITINCKTATYWYWQSGTAWYPDSRTFVCVLTGATETDVTEPGYTESNKITPQVRDTAGIEEPNHPANEELPTILTNQHKYNLYNQGWDQTKIDSFYSANNVYPSNALTWFVLKGSNGTYAPSTVTNHAFGSSLAPRGRYILNAYEMDRDRVSGLPAEDIRPSPFGKHRPEDICFYAGRLWYALDGRLLYSQIISEDSTLVEKCYQAADPTSENVSDPVDTDGGEMNIHQCGKILSISTLGSGLLVFGDKGVVAILPGNSVGFTPTSYYQYLVSSVGATSKRSVVSCGDSVYYWSSLGVYRVAFNEQGSITSTNVSFGTIHSYFKNLSDISKKNCVARFNAVKGEISFMYPTNEDEPKRLDGFLKLNVATNAWTPRSVPLTEVSSPFIVDAIELKNAINTKPKAVVEANGDTVTCGGDAVEITKKDEDYIGFDSLSYLVVDGNSMKVTFANCTNIEHKDWTIGDVTGNGYNYESYITTHPYVFQDIYKNKQAPYITTTFKRSEEGELFPSGCFMSARWDWAFSSDSYKWDFKQQAYRLPANQTYMSGERFKEFVMTKTRVRGTGKSLQLHFESDGSKDFRLCAIGVDARGWIK